MEVVRAVVNLKAILHAIDDHISASDTASHTTYRLATRSTIANVAQRILIAECHIVDIAIAVSKLNTDDRGADVTKLHLRAAAIAHSVEDDTLTLGCRTPNML